MERIATKRSTRTASAVANMGAASFAVAAVWYGLATRGVTMASEPNPSPSIPVAQAQKIYQAWLVTTLHQERLYTGIAVVGFLCLAAVAVFMRDAIGRERPLARIAAMAIVLGAALWVGGNVAHLGAQRAVGLLATHDYSPGTVSAVQFTTDLINEALEVAAFAIIGVGMIAFGVAAAESEFRSRTWERLTFALGIAAVATTISYLGEFFNLKDFLLIATGAVLFPIWMLWSGRRLADA